jgi:hypothetical protein
MLLAPARPRVATDRDPNLAARFCRVSVGVPRSLGLWIVMKG